MSQASSPTHRSKCSFSTSSLNTMKLLTRISSMDLTAWKACRSCSAASLSMCPDSLARKAEAGWISSDLRSQQLGDRVLGQPVHLEGRA